MKMPFGKFRDVEIELIPDEYLEWLLKNVPDLDPLLFEEVRRQLGHQCAHPLELLKPRFDVLRRSVTGAVDKWRRGETKRNELYHGTDEATKTVIEQFTKEFGDALDLAFSKATVRIHAVLDGIGEKTPCVTE